MVRPSAPNTAFRLAILAGSMCSRMPSSESMTGPVGSSGSAVIGTIWSRNFPARVAACARSWLRALNASNAARLRSNLSFISSDDGPCAISPPS